MRVIRMGKVMAYLAISVPWPGVQTKLGCKRYRKGRRSHVGASDTPSSRSDRRNETMFEGADWGKWNRIDPRGVNSISYMIALAQPIAMGVASRARKKEFVSDP